MRPVRGANRGLGETQIANEQIYGLATLAASADLLFKAWYYVSTEVHIIGAANEKCDAVTQKNRQLE